MKFKLDKATSFHFQEPISFQISFCHFEKVLFIFFKILNELTSNYFSYLTTKRRKKKKVRYKFLWLVFSWINNNLHYYVFFQPITLIKRWLKSIVILPHRAGQDDNRSQFFKFIHFNLFCNLYDLKRGKLCVKYFNLTD